jgi:hypothetical protein
VKVILDMAVESETQVKEALSNSKSDTDYESNLIALGELYRDNNRPNDLAELVKTSRTNLSSFAKAKTAKLGERSSMIIPGAICTNSNLSSTTT